VGLVWTLLSANLGAMLGVLGLAIRAYFGLRETQIQAAAASSHAWDASTSAQQAVKQGEPLANGFTTKVLGELAAIRLAVQDVDKRVVRVETDIAWLRERP
jgi:hypothetical protein